MNYNKKYKNEVDKIVKIIEEDKDKPKKMSLKEKHIFEMLYEDLNNGIDLSHLLYENNKIKLDIEENDNSVPSGGFIDKTISDYISNTNKKVFKYTVDLLGRIIIIKFYIFNKENEQYLIRGLKNIISWLIVCSKYSSIKCNKILNIDIYLTDKEKTFPEEKGDILGPINLNTGYSGVCLPDNQIVIYRKEEWFKVFIHETFHAYEFQPNHVNDELLLKGIKGEIEGINADISITEMYVEVWARIINSCYSSIYNSNNLNEFLSILSFNLRVESIFSIIQGIRVLDYMDLNFEDIIKKNKSDLENKYKEETNVFSYIILSSVVLNNSYNFISWCYKNNVNIFKFNDSREKVKLFVNLIKADFKKRKTRAMYKNLNNLKGMEIGLRFSIIKI
tara:strand:- start:5812 stop:6984 length:1173 start_codon:yes stop_codon:yes gene_type:complete